MIFASITSGEIFRTLFFSFFLSLIFVPVMRLLAIRINLMDRPNSQPHKQHAAPVPISGGPAFFATLITVALIFLPLFDAEIRALIGASAIIFVFGVWDDFRPVRPFVKLSAQFAATILMILFCTRVHVVESLLLPFSLPLHLIQTLDILITVFWMLFITNAYNLVDSMDGLMVGLSSLGLTFFILAAIDTHQWSLAILCATMLGSCIVLNFFNAHPAFLFMGDSGAQTIGFLMGAIAILYKQPDKLQSTTWFLPILLLGVPIFDTVLVTFSRIRRRTHIYTGGFDHTYHRLVALGLSKIQAVQLMLLVAIALMILAFFAISQTPLLANLIFLLIILAGIFSIFFLENGQRWIQRFSKPKKE